jgi:hypothetical protein
MKLRELLIAATVALATVVGAGTANAVSVLDDWNLNLGIVNGTAVGATVFNGLANATDIDHTNVVGFATIQQTVVGGSALNQPFAESGLLQFATYTKEGAALSTNFNIGNAGGLYLSFTGLTGTLNGDSTITFNTPSGAIGLFLDSDGDGNPLTGDVLTLATYEIIAPSGGSDLNFFGGTAANATVDVTLRQLTGIDGLFTDTSGNDLELPFVLHLVNVDSLLDPNFNPNPDNSGVIGGNGTSIIHVQNNGQYNLAVPEPGTLGLLGGGLLFMGWFWRRQKREA